MLPITLAFVLFTAAPTWAQEGKQAPAEPKKSGEAPFATRKRSNVGEGGPTQPTDKAMLDGMRWLIRHQNEDGSWSAETLHSRCKSSPACGGEGVGHDPVRDVALTALAIESFIGAGFSHVSRQDIVDMQMGERHKMGEVVGRGLAWLVAQQHEDGSFGPTVNGLNVNAIATMVLCEAQANAGDGTYEPAAKKALAFLCTEQLANPSGKGRFGFGSSESKAGAADVVATAWAVNAFYSAKLSGIAVDQASLDGIVEYARFLETNAQDASASNARGNEDWAAFMRFFAAPSQRDAGLDRGEKNVMASLPSKQKGSTGFDWTRWYFDALLLHQLGYPLSALKTSNAWVEANKAQVDALLLGQDHTEKNCRHGGWLALDDERRELGPIYSTTMAVRMLGVYHRYPPAFLAPTPPPAPAPTPPAKKK